MILLMGTFGVTSADDPVIKSSDIIIEDPIGKTVVPDETVFITINVSGKPSTYEYLQVHPMTIVLVELEKIIPFADQLGDSLNVPMVKLTRNSSFKTISNTSFDESDYLISDENYSEEIKIINDYFEQSAQIKSIQQTIDKLNSLYQFESAEFSESQILYFTLEKKAGYTEYMSLKGQLAELKRSFASTERKYAKLFESIVLKKEMANPSISIDAGRLNRGDYKIIIKDEANHVIKEAYFSVTSGDVISDTITLQP